MAVTVNWKRGFKDVDCVTLLDVLFEFFVRWSQLVCDPLGQVMDHLVRHRLIKLPVEEVSLFSVGKASEELSKRDLGQDIYCCSDKD